MNEKTTADFYLFSLKSINLLNSINSINRFKIHKNDKSMVQFFKITEKCRKFKKSPRLRNSLRPCTSPRRLTGPRRSVSSPHPTVSWRHGIRLLASPSGLLALRNPLIRLSIHLLFHLLVPHLVHKSPLPLLADSFLEPFVRKCN